ncbi:sigma-70 family RNA polymerase sigma factor [Acidaminobacter sp. JC074]|uniref:sigma-70 family RNA polymerase sigma factor n=1 Tax=Acidaminobacter sp. JC074 TaxID=2530199 RepID=UPI001F0DB590|nr:sigma-70 family RNA polymerase sigma factor [Acidaminobacter sp. JC074]
MNRIYVGISIDEIVNKYSDMLIRIAFQNLKSIHDAEDIAQSVYIKLIEKDPDFVSEDHLKSWLIRVCINKCKDHFKSSWFKKTCPLDNSIVLFAPEEKEILEEVFQLQREDRNIIYLYYYEGYSIREIASILRKKENTISSKLQRARKKLKVLIQEGRIG